MHSAGAYQIVFGTNVGVVWECNLPIYCFFIYFIFCLCLFCKVSIWRSCNSLHVFQFAYVSVVVFFLVSYYLFSPLVYLFLPNLIVPKTLVDVHSNKHCFNSGWLNQLSITDSAKQQIENVAGNACIFQCWESSLSMIFLFLIFILKIHSGPFTTVHGVHQCWFGPFDSFLTKHVVTFAMLLLKSYIFVHIFEQ